MGEFLECKKVVAGVPAPPVETEFILKHLRSRKRTYYAGLESLRAHREEEQSCSIGAYRGQSKPGSPEETERSLQLACDWQSSALGQCRRLPRALLRWSRTMEGGLVAFPDSLQSDPPLMAQRIPRRITLLSFKIYLLLIHLRQFSTVLGYSYTAIDSDIPSNLQYILILS